eukprot:CAMPEP_0196742540 /NCGR_PEP_ID=MMETSP1091-20130531/47471_1 /TAXON_ID=302021 /ORGANISM="Rhodomonas sp., Strain CCMP768" /LENGTH=83 /DNA_ID=CAMNT_0042088619 /DNA_START=56 /DNA_END=307 /DNA_ORIENTATION=+
MARGAKNPQVQAAENASPKDFCLRCMQLCARRLPNQQAKVMQGKFAHGGIERRGPAAMGPAREEAEEKELLGRAGGGEERPGL